MVHAPHTKFHVVSTVLETGVDGNLAKGQFAVVKNKAAKGGKIVINDFDGMTARDLIALEIGEASFPSGLRTLEVPYKSTGWFPIGSITDIKAYAPSNVKLTVDHLEVGFDGTDNKTALFIPEGKAALMDITVSGQVASMFFGRSHYSIQKVVYRAVGETMQEVIRRAVKEINEEMIPTAMGWASTTDQLSQFLEVGVTDSSTVTTVGVDSTFATLTLVDAGDSNDLADIQAQYPLYKVTRTSRDGGTSVYSLVKPTAAPAIASYVKTTVDVNGKDCANCLPGYTEIAGGFVYHIAIEDDGVDLTSTVAGLLTGETALVKFGNKDGKGIYSALMPAVLTQVQYDAFIVARPEAELTLIGDVKTVCSKTSSVTTPWVNGKTCTATTKNFNITLKDNECGQSRLIELQKTYPELTIVEGIDVAGVITPKVGGCKRVYSTKVLTNIVCTECSPIFLQPFYAEAPLDFEGFAWENQLEVFDVNAKMGIFVKGRVLSVYPEAYEEDFVPFIETSLKVDSISFGYMGDNSLTHSGTFYNAANEFFEGRHLVYSKDVKNLSQSYFGAEDEGNIFGTNKTKFKSNLFARANMSQERQLGYNKRILKYIIYTHDTSLSQGGSGRSDISHGFGLLIEEGKQAGLELILNKLAAKVGLPAVNASAT